MIHIFFLFQTHRASTWTAKISSFKLVLRRNLAFVCFQAKKQTFLGALDFQTDLTLGSNSLTIHRFPLCGTKTLDEKTTLTVKWPQTVIIALNLLARK